MKGYLLFIGLVFLGLLACSMNENEVKKTISAAEEIRPKNVLGEPLESCCSNPMTGYYRDGYCRTGETDYGVHTVCAVMTAEFLTYTGSCGNDLSTPNPRSHFPGLQPGDKWCLCASRWLDAHKAGKAPFVKLEATDAKTLEIVPLEILKTYRATQGKS